MWHAASLWLGNRIALRRFVESIRGRNEFGQSLDSTSSSKQRFVVVITHLVTQQTPVVVKPRAFHDQMYSRLEGYTARAVGGLLYRHVVIVGSDLCVPGKALNQS